MSFSLKVIIRNLLANKNTVTDLDQNGELYFLKKVLKASQKQSTPIIIFDVGANNGKYSEIVVREVSDSKQPVQLHLFEPQKTCIDTLNDLKRKFDSPNLAFSINNCAISLNTGKQTLNFDKEGSSHASLFKRNEVSLDLSNDVDVISLKKYITEMQLSYITLLKIDTEGAELSVLKSAEEFLKPSFIHNIQFEYGGTYRDANTTLKETYRLLKSKGYNIGKLTKNKILYVNSDVDVQEDYSYSNYSATKDILR